MGLLHTRSGLIKYKIDFKMLILIIIALVAKSECIEDAKILSDNEAGKQRQQDDRYFKTICHQCEKRQIIIVTNHQLSNLQSFQNKSNGKCFYPVFQKQPEKPSAQHKNNGLPFVDQIKHVYIWLNNLVSDFFTSSDKNENCVGCQKKTVIVAKDKQWKTSNLMHHTLDSIFCIYSYANKCKNPNFINNYGKKKRKIKVMKRESWKLANYRNASNLTAERTEKQGDKTVLLASDTTNNASSRPEIGAAAILEHPEHPSRSSTSASTFVPCNDGTNWFYRVASIFRLKSKISASKKHVRSAEENVKHFDKFMDKDLTCRKKCKAFERIDLGRKSYFYIPMFSLICSLRKQFRNRTLNEMDNNSRTSGRGHMIASSKTPMNAGILSERIVSKETPPNKYFDHLMNNKSSMYYLPTNQITCKQPATLKSEKASKNSTRTQRTSIKLNEQIHKLYSNSRHTFHPISNILSLKCPPLHTKKRAHKVESNIIVKNDTKEYWLEATQTKLNKSQQHKKSTKSREEIFSLLSLCFLLVCKNPNMKNRTSQLPINISGMSDKEYKRDRNNQNNTIVEELAAHVDAAKTSKQIRIVKTVVEENDRNKISMEETKDRFILGDVKSLVSVKDTESIVSLEERKSSVLIMNTESRTVLGRDEIVVPIIGTEVKLSLSSMEHRQSTKTVALSDDKKVNQRLASTESQVTQKSSISEMVRSVQLSYKESKQPKKYEQSSLESRSSSISKSATAESTLLLSSVASNNFVEVDQLEDGETSLLLSTIPSIALAEDQRKKHLSPHITPAISLEMSKSTLASKASKILSPESDLKSTVASKHIKQISPSKIVKKRSVKNSTEKTALLSSKPSASLLKYRKDGAVSMMGETTSPVPVDTASLTQTREATTHEDITPQRVRESSFVVNKHQLSSKKIIVATKNLDAEMPQATKIVDEQGMVSKSILAPEMSNTVSATPSNVERERSSKIVRSRSSTETRIDLSVAQEPDASAATTTKTDHEMKSLDTSPNYRVNAEILPELKSVAANNKPRTSSDVPISVTNIEKKEQLKSKEHLTSRPFSVVHSGELKMKSEDKSSEILESTTVSLVTFDKLQTAKLVDDDSISTISSITKVSIKTHEGNIITNTLSNDRVDSRIDSTAERTRNDTLRQKMHSERTSKETDENSKIVIFPSKSLPTYSDKSSAKTIDKIVLRSTNAFEAQVKSPSVHLQKERLVSAISKSANVLLSNTVVVDLKKNAGEGASDTRASFSGTSSLLRPQSQKVVTLKLESFNFEKESHKSQNKKVTDIDESFTHPFEPTKSFSETKRIMMKESSSKTALKESDIVGSKTSASLLETGVQGSLAIDTEISTTDIENVESPALAVKLSELSKNNITRTETNDATKQSIFSEDKKSAIASAMKVIKSGDPLEDLPYHAQPSTMAVSDKKSVEYHKEQSAVTEPAERQDLDVTAQMIKEHTSFDENAEKEIKEGKIVAISPDFVVLATLAVLVICKLLKTSLGSSFPGRSASEGSPQETTQQQPPDEPDAPAVTKMPRLETTVAIADIFMKPDETIGYEVRRSGKG